MYVTNERRVTNERHEMHLAHETHVMHETHLAHEKHIQHETSSVVDVLRRPGRASSLKSSQPSLNRYNACNERKACIARNLCNA